MSEIEFMDNNPSLKHNLKGHRKNVTCLSFHPDENQLVSSSFDNSVMLWNLASPHQKCYKFVGHTDNVNCVQFSNDGRLIASCSSDQTVRLWVPNIRGGNTSFKAHSSSVNTISFSSGNDKILTGSNDKSLKVWNTKHRQFMSSFSAHTNWVKCAKFSNDGSFIASCADDRTIRIFDVNSGQCVHIFTSDKGSGNYLSIHPNCKSIVVGMNSGSIRLYDLRAKKLQQHYILHDNTTCVDWHPHAHYFLCCGQDGTMKIVDVMEGKPLYTLEGHTAGLQTVTFSKSGNKFASGGGDTHILIWNTNFINVPSTSNSSRGHGDQESI